MQSYLSYLQSKYKIEHTSADINSLFDNIDNKREWYEATSQGEINFIYFTIDGGDKVKLHVGFDNFEEAYISLGRLLTLMQKIAYSKECNKYIYEGAYTGCQSREGFRLKEVEPSTRDGVHSFSGSMEMLVKLMYVTAHILDRFPEA